MDKNDMPLGFGFALAFNSDAMRRFSFMTESEREEILRKAHTVSSKEEMQSLVDGLKM